MKRARVAIRGAVQGVGFRPFVYRLATELRLAGWVVNSTQGVAIEVEGDEPRLREFILRIETEKPQHAFIQSFEFSLLDPVNYAGFTIRSSVDDEVTDTVVLPDIATCPDCLREIFAPGDRRFRYPFTNCTRCGPRYSIIESLPYDRARTSMKTFAMCEDCRREYEDVADRRFHAQPIACPACGPHLELWSAAGTCLAAHDDALRAAARALRDGQVIAVKGLGGFQLLVDAQNPGAVDRLRERKRREQKPFALMYASLDAVARDCHLSPLERRLLASSECPIVLVARRRNAGVAPQVAPGTSTLGIMLPCTPLHHLLLGELSSPVVATSGNLAEEPICTDERDALRRLQGLADLFLIHNRPIVRHVDDSIVRVLLGRELVLRRARGYAPLPQHLQQPLPATLAVGAHLKNTVALVVGHNVFVSQHIGDLENEPAHQAFRDVIRSFRSLYRVSPQQIAADLHPDYLSTQYARSTGLPIVAIQHHLAHVVACMAENELAGEVLGVAWDGLGYGPDGTIWGGEFLVTDGVQYRRAAALRKFRLPGGERAIREPRRSALGALFEILGDALFERRDLTVLRAFADAELGVLRTMLHRQVSSPWTSSAGRLFDVVASLTGLRQRASFEGQAAMELENAVDESQQPARGLLSCSLLPNPAPTPQPSALTAQPLAVVDWEPLLLGLLDLQDRQVPVPVLAAEFHGALADAIVQVARWSGQERVVLTGGCFQNRHLTECAVQKLQDAGFRPYWHQRFPPNDGSLALGQAIAAGWQQIRRTR